MNQQHRPNHKEKTWVLPQWMQEYCGTYLPEENILITHMNSHRVNVQTNAPLAMMIVGTRIQVELLTKLKENQKLQ